MEDKSATNKFITKILILMFNGSKLYWSMHLGVPQFPIPVISISASSNTSNAIMIIKINAEIKPPNKKTFLPTLQAFIS